MKGCADACRWVVLLVIVAFWSVALLVACRESVTPRPETESTTTTSQGGPPSSSPGTMSPGETPSSASLNESFSPEGRSIEADEFQALVGDFPIYPGARLMARRKTPTETTLTLASSDVLATVLHFYQNRLQEIGWPMEMSDEPGHGVLLRGTKGKRTYALFLTEGESRTFIQVTLTEATPSTHGGDEKGRRDRAK